jgi:hypothetical protein
LEFRLHRLLFNSCERPAGFVLGHYQVGGQSDDYLAPSDAVGNSPLTWTLLSHGAPNRDYQLEKSDTLLNWNPVLTASSPDGVIRYDVPPGQAERKRFYRAVLLP